MDSAAKRSSMRSAVYDKTTAAAMGRPIVKLNLFAVLSPENDADTGTLYVNTDKKAGEPIYLVQTSEVEASDSPVTTERFRTIYAARYAELLRAANAINDKGDDAKAKTKTEFIARLKAVALNLKIKERKFTNFEYLEQKGLELMSEASLAGDLGAYNRAYKNLAKLRKSKAKYGEVETLEDKKITIFKDQKIGPYAIQSPLDLAEMKKILSKYGAEEELQIMDQAVTESNKTLYSILDLGGKYFAGKPVTEEEVKVVKDRGISADRIAEIKRNALSGQPRLYFNERLVDPVTSESGVVLPQKQVMFNPDPQDDLNALAGEIAIRSDQKKIEAVAAKQSLAIEAGKN